MLERALAPVTILPLGLHLEPGKEMSATAFVSLGPRQDLCGDALRPEALEASVEEELNAIHKFLATHGEDVNHRWPGAGEPLPRAPEGVFGGG
jgi:hypothetical protein